MMSEPIDELNLNGENQKIKKKCEEKGGGPVNLEGMEMKSRTCCCRV